MKRRRFLKSLVGTIFVISQSQKIAWSKTYLTVDQAREILFPGEQMEKVEVTLDKVQMKAVQKASKTRVRNSQLNVWKTENGSWFILDQVIGKHENIDLAFAFNKEGKVKGFEILTYRETYGHEIRNPKWRSQFHGLGHEQHLKLDKQIQNISGATLSCRHVTDGINRLSQTWNLILQYLP